MKTRTLPLAMLILAFVGFFPGLAMTGSNPAPPPIFQTFTHLGVKASNIVQIETDFGPGGFEGWIILRANGSTSSFAVPEGQVLVVTDVFLNTVTTATGGGFSLSISKTINGIPTHRQVYSFNSTSGETALTKTFQDHMTTGFLVPAGWQLEEPQGSLDTPSIKLQGYFTSAQ